MHYNSQELLNNSSLRPNELESGPVASQGIISGGTNIEDPKSKSIIKLNVTNKDSSEL